MKKYKRLTEFPDYAVSNDGAIWSYKSNRELKTNMSPAGYINISLYDNANKRRTVLVHRLVAMAWIEGYKKGLIVNHKNGIRHDNRVSNLEWMSQSENIKHSYRAGSTRKSHARVIDATPEELENETWVFMHGFRGIYEVSSLGRVRSISRVYTRAGSKHPIYHYGKMKTPTKRNGYYTVHLCKPDGTRVRRSVHKLVLESFTRNVENKLKRNLIVNHIDGDKTNNKLSNLEWVTYSQNTQHYHDTIKKRKL